MTAASTTAQQPATDGEALHGDGMTGPPIKLNAMSLNYIDANGGGFGALA